MNYSGYFSNCSPFRFKTLFCMPLKTGCYLFSFLYLVPGVWLFVDEIERAEFSFSYSLYSKHISVFFTYDVMPTVLLTFSIFFIFGLYKEHPLFVYSGISLLYFLSALVIMTFVDKIIRFRYYTLFSILEIFLIQGVFLMSLIAMKSYYNELLFKKTKTRHTLEECQTASTNEFENPQLFS